jgi:hypothetical protein
MTTDEALAVGEKRQVEISARKLWNDTGIDVKEGERYRLRADGTWRDLLILSGPDGYDAPWYSLGQRLAGGRRRVPSARWFALIGAVSDGRSKPFVIGSECLATMPASGSLRCFANDVRGFYWNNFGAVSLRIERLS